MPETWFYVRWPDDSHSRCYSPSTAVRTHFEPGANYPMEEFLERSRRALGAAGERVREKYGFTCSSADEQLAAIERRAAHFAGQPDARVRIEGFEP